MYEYDSDTSTWVIIAQGGGAPVGPHSSTHSKAQSDAVKVENLGTSGATGTIPVSDGILPNSGLVMTARAGIDSTAVHSGDIPTGDLGGTYPNPSVALVGGTAASTIGAHPALTNNPHAVTQTQVGLANVQNIKDNNAGVVDPTVTDDSSAGYAIGSRWINTAEDTAFVCTDASVGTATWVKITNETSVPETPGQYFLGAILDYVIDAAAPIGEVQYARVYLPKDRVLTQFHAYIVRGGLTGRNINIGLYDQATPSSTTGTPRNRVTQTGALTTNGANGTYLTATLGTPYTVPATGYYWVALVTDSDRVEFAVTQVFRANFLPTRREASTGTTLPATAGTLTNPASAVAYAAVLE
jgi:hypothetical protein